MADDDMANDNVVVSDKDDSVDESVNSNNDNSVDESVDSERCGDMCLQLADNHERSAIDSIALKAMQASLNTQEEELALMIEEFEATLCQDITDNAEIEEIVAIVNDQEQKLRICQKEGKEQKLALLLEIYEREKQDLLDRLFLSKDETKKKIKAVRDRVLSKWFKQSHNT